jgi:hypothetical protein
MRAEVDSLQAECARHPPTRLNPRAAAIGLQPPACSPCPLGLNEPRPLWRATCKGGGCAVEPAGTQQPYRGGELTQPSSPTPPGPAALGPAETSCAGDAECVILTLEIEDDLPRTRACCPGCSAHAVNREWAARFRSSCESAPPSQCPPLGCPMPLLRAACRAGQCAVAQ